MDLPRKPKEITVEVRDGITFTLAPLTDAQLIAIRKNAHMLPDEVEAGKVMVQLPDELLPGIFDANVRSGEGVTIDGEPFDGSDIEHVGAIPTNWKLIAGAELGVRAIEGQSAGDVLPEETRGNSKARAARSRKGSTRSRSSARAKSSS